MPALRRTRSLQLFWRYHRWLYQASGGRLGARLLGKPVLLLFTTGRKPGLSRTNTLYYLTDAGRYVVIASNAGYAKHPAWYLNLAADPQVRVQVGTDKYAATARTATGEERERLWKAALEFDSSYAEYERQTDREIPVVVLEPQPGG